MLRWIIRTENDNGPSDIVIDSRTEAFRQHSRCVHLALAQCSTQMCIRLLEVEGSAPPRTLITTEVLGPAYVRPAQSIRSLPDMPPQ